MLGIPNECLLYNKLFCPPRPEAIVSCHIGMCLLGLRVFIDDCIHKHFEMFLRRISKIFLFLVMFRAWIFVILLARLQATFSLPKKKIFMGALVLSYNKDEQGIQAAMEYATETINNRSDILKDYELVVKYAETLVSISEPCLET